MSFRLFVEEARDLSRKALVSLNYEVPDTLEWDEPPAAELGDVSLRVGYQLSKKLGRKPLDIASSIASKINTDYSAEMNLVGSVEAHPSGFLNFRMNKQTFSKSVLLESQSIDYGRINLGSGESVLVEHTAVNPNKALHIGHLRNVAVGDAISRIFKFAGYDVNVLNYIDDSGLQVADVLVGLMFLDYPKEAPPGVKYDHYAGDSIYVNVNKRYEQEPRLRDHQRYILKAIEEKNPAVFPFAAEITEKILRQQLATCWRFGGFYDLLVYESDIVQSKLWDYVFSELKSKGIAKYETHGKYEGCWIVSVQGEKEGEDKVLVRADGTATYNAKDIPLAGLKVGVIPDRFQYSEYVVQPNDKLLWRTRSDEGASKKSPVPWGASKSITVIDSRQARLQRIIQYILGQLTGTDMENRYLHLGYAIISLSPKTAASLLPQSEVLTHLKDEEAGIVTMSGRKGTYINADDVLDAVKGKALAETKKRNEDVADQEWLQNVAEKLAISAVRFGLLKQDLDKIIVFDMEESLKLIGETGPYMLYTFARASSIMSKIEAPSGGNIRADLLSSASEINLIKMISKFDIYLEKAVKMMAPKWIAHYSFELCEAFNKFYEMNRVIQEENKDIREARRALVQATRGVLKNALGLLGIEALERI